MNFTGPPAARAGAQYAPGVDLRPACVHTCLAEYLRLHKNCFVLQRYTIKTAFPSRIYQSIYIYLSLPRPTESVSHFAKWIIQIKVI